VLARTFSWMTKLVKLVINSVAWETAARLIDSSERVCVRSCRDVWSYSLSISMTRPRMQLCSVLPFVF